jgi:hypothetical protein
MSSTGQQQIEAKIESFRKTLEETKATFGLGSDDQSLIALEQILLAKIAELETAKTVAEKSSST